MLRDFQRLRTAKIRTNRLLFNWSTMEARRGSINWGVSDQLIGRLASYGVRSMPFLWGSPRWVAGSPATPPLGSTADRQAWKNFLKAAVARYGPGGSYWANGYRQQFGAERHAAADPFLADLERAQPGEVLRAEPIARQVRPAAADLQERDREPGSAGPDRAWRHARLRRIRGPGTSSTASTTSAT